MPSQEKISSIKVLNEIVQETSALIGESNAKKMLTTLSLFSSSDLPIRAETTAVFYFLNFINDHQAGAKHFAYFTTFIDTYIGIAEVLSESERRTETKNAFRKK